MFIVGIEYWRHFYEGHGHGLNSQGQNIQLQNPTKPPFSNVDLVWVKGECYRGSNKKSFDVAYIPYAHVQDFLEGEWGDLHTPMEWNIHNNMPTRKDVKNPTIWHHLKHTRYVSHEGIAFICLLFTRIVVHKIGMQPFLNWLNMM